jgi:methylmalonyl-CoA/ethylmalonyl-CoA epimerase
MVTECTPRAKRIASARGVHLEETNMAKLKRIDHIGIAVKDLQKSLQPYREILGLTLNGIETVEFGGATLSVAFLPLGGTEVELLHTTGTTGIVTEHIAKHGEGINHIAFEVDDIDSLYQELKSKGVEFLTKGIVPGSRNTRVLFFAPEEFNGVYIEAIEMPKTR